MNKFTFTTLVLLLTLALFNPLWANGNLESEREQRDEAQRSWQDARNEIKKIINQAKDAVSTIQSTRIAIENFAKEISALINEKAKVLRELMEGRYCDQCHRSASEIERETGKPFQEHLQSVNGNPEPAPPEVIEAANKKYTDLINDKQRSKKQYEDKLATSIDQRLNLSKQALDLKLFHVYIDVVSEIEHHNNMIDLIYDDRIERFDSLARDLLEQNERYKQAVQKNLPATALNALKNILDSRSQEIWNYYLLIRKEHDSMVLSELDRKKTINIELENLSRYMGSLDNDYQLTGAYLQGSGTYSLPSPSAPTNLRDLIDYDAWTVVYLWKESRNLPDAKGL